MLGGRLLWALDLAGGLQPLSHGEAVTAPLAQGSLGRGVLKQALEVESVLRNGADPSASSG